MAAAIQPEATTRESVSIALKTIGAESGPAVSTAATDVLTVLELAGRVDEQRIEDEILVRPDLETSSGFNVRIAIARLILSGVVVRCAPADSRIRLSDGVAALLDPARER